MNIDQNCVKTPQTCTIELFYDNSERLKVLNYFLKKLHLRCLTGS